MLRHPGHREGALAVQHVQPLTQHLPRPPTRHIGPLRGRQRQVGQHLERHVRHNLRRSSPECQQVLHQPRQRRRVGRLADQPGIEGVPPRILGLGVNHADHVRQRGRIADRGRQKLRVAGRVQPVLHHFLGPRAQRFAPSLTRAQDLHESPQHAPRGDHLGKRRLKQRRVTAGQHGQQQRGRILHVALGANMHGGLRQKHRLDRFGRSDKGRNLGLRVLIEAAAETAGHRQLCQLMFGTIGISLGACGVRGGRLGQQAPGQGCKHGFVCHDLRPSLRSPPLDAGNRRGRKENRHYLVTT